MKQDLPRRARPKRHHAGIDARVLGLVLTLLLQHGSTQNLAGTESHRYTVAEKWCKDWCFDLWHTALLANGQLVL